MSSTMSLFILIAFAVLTALYWYVGWRLISPSGLGPVWRRTWWTVMAAFLILAPMPIVLRSLRIENGLVDFLAWPSYLGLGFITLLFFIVVFRDLLWLLIRAIEYVQFLVSNKNRPGIQAGRVVDTGRRNFLENSIYGFLEAKRHTAIFEVDIPVRDLPRRFNGFRIVQITDIHVSPTIKGGWVRQIVSEVNNLDADLIAFTGDLADGTVKHLRKDVESLADLTAPYGKFFVTGNHEYYSGAESWVEEVERLGMTVLLNEYRIIRAGTACLVLAGVTDFTGGQFIPSHASDPKAALHNAPDSSVRILLAHQPRSIFIASQEGYHLQISGHTHGGQFYPWNFVVRMTQPYISGLHRHENTWIYVSRGTGYWGPPVRIGAPSEITVLTLRTPDEYSLL